jgi:hypothetical protein
MPPRSIARPPKAVDGLRKTVQSVIADSPTAAQVNTLVQSAHAIALMLIRSKQSRGLVLVSQGISDSDLAYDCIADLFRKNSEGVYAGLRAYFTSIDLDAADDPEVLVYLRRLVSSAVNQGLFRVFNEIDPALGKIIRNIKLSVQGLRNFTETEVFGELCITPILCDPLNELNQFDREELMRRLLTSVRGCEKVPEMLAALSNLVRRQHEFSRNVPIVVVALAIKDVYQTKRLMSPVSVDADAILGDHDAVWVIDTACSDIKARVSSKYLRSGKVSDGLVDSYFLAVKAYLLNKLDGNDDDVTLFSSLNTVLIQMNRREYQRRHRARLEYLARMVRRRVVALMQKDR